MEHSQKFVKLHIGSDSITCTVEHPFFENRKWVAAKDLRQGDSLFAFSGDKLRIDSLHQFKTDTATAVYNLEVAGNNDFYVSGSKVLVHNCETNSIRVVGKLLESVDDVFANPNLLKFKSPLEVEGILGKTSGWRIEKLGKGAHKGQGLVLREYGIKEPTGRMIQWHPGGGHHGPKPYWKVSSQNGTFRIYP